MSLSSPGWTGSAPSVPRVERPTATKAVVPFFIEQNNTHYENVLQRLPTMLHAMDGSGRILSANSEWLKVLGYELSDIIGRSLSEFLPAEARTKLITAIYPRYLVTGQCDHEELMMLRKDGSLATMLLSMVAFRGENGRLQKSICQLEDTTQRKLAEIAASRADTRFKTAFMSSAQGMAIISPTGGIQVANAAFRVFLRREDIEQITISFDDLIHRDDRGQFLNGMRQLLNSEIPVLHQDIRYMTGDGKVAHGASSVSMVRNDKGETEQLVVQVMDITQKRLMTNRLQDSERMDALSQLTGSVATEFNNLLGVMTAKLRSLEGQVSGGDAAKRSLEEVATAAAAGQELTKRLLSFARQQHLNPRDCGAHDVLDAVEAKFRPMLPPEFTLDIRKMAGDPRLLVDPAELQGALLQIAYNAAEAMPDGGKVTMVTEGVHLDHDYASQHPGVAAGEYVLISVSDIGRGMPQDMLDKIYHPFFTTKRAGTGAGHGLSAAYGFIRQSGGHIVVESEIGNGSTVKVYLPRRMRVADDADAGAPAWDGGIDGSTGAEPVPAENAARKPKILVVEDQEAVRAVACGFLEDFGYDCIEAGDGFEALQKLQEAQDIDLMFSDVVMPGGMNGFDLAQAAQSMRPDLKVVHTSGYPKGAMVHQDEPRFKEGFIIMKPYRREDLQKIIKDALESQ